MAKLIFIICLTTCVPSITAESQCSPFHYREKLLEKVINVQYKMEIYSDKMEKWESAITDKLSKLEDNFEQKMDIHVGKIKLLESAITDKLSKLEDKLEQQAQPKRKLPNTKMLGSAMTDKLSKLDDKLKQQEQLERKLTKSVNDTLADATELIRNLRKESLDLQAAAKTPVILFKARHSRSESLSEGGTIVFQDVVQNEGNGYNRYTGIFTAPVTGTYLFTVQVCLYDNSELSVSIVAGGNSITAATFGGDRDWDGMCGSSEGLALLQPKEEVKVLVTFTYYNIVIYPDSTRKRWTSFSGVLLH